MTNVKMVFSVSALSFEGDLPASIFHMQLIENDVEDWKAAGSGCRLLAPAL
jgi:hypothetical protein